jgi:hypothetical protein
MVNMANKAYITKRKKIHLEKLFLFYRLEMYVINVYACSELLPGEKIITNDLLCDWKKGHEMDQIYCRVPCYENELEWVIPLIFYCITVYIS